MNNPIEGRDCMVQAVASIVGDPNITNQLYTLRFRQMEARKGKLLDTEAERLNLIALFAAIGQAVFISIVVINSLAIIDGLLSQGKTILAGLPMGQSSQPPHIVHLAEKHKRPTIIKNGMVQLGFNGYKSDQEYTSAEELMDAMLVSGEIPLFIIERS